MPRQVQLDDDSEECDVSRVIDLLVRDDVREAYQKVLASPRPIQTIADLIPPAGLSSEETWDLMSCLERLSATYSPFPNEAGIRYWWIYTERIYQGLSEIDQFCTSDSPLLQATTSRGGSRFLVMMKAQESIAAAQLNGASIDSLAGKELLLMQHRPRTPHERLVANHFALQSELDKNAHQPLTPKILMDLHRRLTSGVSVIDDRARYATSEGMRDELLTSLCTYLDEHTRIVSQHPALVALATQIFVVRQQPFPSWNGMMSRVIFRAATLRLGYPVLGDVPISQSELALTRMRSATGEPTDDRVRLLKHLGEGNVTPWIDKQVTIAVHALRQFRADIERARAIDEAVREELADDPSLNARQRSIIGRALRLPQAAFRIGYHRNRHGIGYATAYRDLEELVEKGYLVQDNEDKTKVFRIGPALEARAATFADRLTPEQYQVPLPKELTEDSPV